jgi:predicted dehydrogenase
METRRIGIILNGVTGRMGTNQHLIRSILAIIKQGGVKVNDDLVLMPEPVLTGRNENKLKPLAVEVAKREIGRELPYTTDLDTALGEKKNEVFFDASGTLQRAGFVEKAVKAGKSIYCEKPTATTTAEALRLAELVEKAKLKNGVVQDKLWLPGFRKIAMLKELGFFGKILSVRGEFGYWVFTGLDVDQPAQRPSWNYRAEDGGGIMIDMFCHWQYVISNLFGPIKSLVAYGNTDIPERRDESGKVYKATADDSAYAIFVLEDGTVCQFNSSWCVRVRRRSRSGTRTSRSRSTSLRAGRRFRTTSRTTTPSRFSGSCSCVTWRWMSLSAGRSAKAPRACNWPSWG